MRIIAGPLRDSPFSHLLSPIRTLKVAVACVAMFPAVTTSQEIATFRDTLVMRQVAYRAPCPVPPPRAWSLRDSTLGSGLRCSLVEAAARAIRQFQEVRPPIRGPADPWNPLCVRLVVGRNTGSTGLPGDWLVLFDLAPDTPAWVIVDRQTGSIALVSVGYGSPGNLPPCLD